jgi:hypothetical protein
LSSKIKPQHTLLEKLVKFIFVRLMHLYINTYLAEKSENGSGNVPLTPSLNDLKALDSSSKDFDR